MLRGGARSGQERLIELRVLCWAEDCTARTDVEVPAYTRLRVTISGTGRPVSPLAGECRCGAELDEAALEEALIDALGVVSGTGGTGGGGDASLRGRDNARLALWTATQTGDAGQRATAEAALAEAVDPLLGRLAANEWRAAAGTVEYDVLLAEARLHAVKLMREYEPARGALDSYLRVNVSLRLRTVQANERAFQDYGAAVDHTTWWEVRKHAHAARVAVREANDGRDGTPQAVLEQYHAIRGGTRSRAEAVVDLLLREPCCASMTPAAPPADRCRVWMCVTMIRRPDPPAR